MPNTKLTRDRLINHFQYSKMLYLVIIVVAALIGNLAFSVTTYHAPNERRVDIELIGLYADTEKPSAREAAARLLAAGQDYERARDAAAGLDQAEDYEIPLQELEFIALQYDPESSSEENYYAAQKFMVMLAAQEGDIYVLSRTLLLSMLEQNLLLPLDDYIASGALDPGERNLGRVTFDGYDDEGNATTDQHVYALQADTLTGLYDAASYDPEGKYLAVTSFSRNPDTAVAVMQGMINLFEAPAEETAGEAAPEAAQ